MGSLLSTQSLHAHLIKRGLKNHTLLCNHLIHLYSKLGLVQSSLNCFSELSVKNTFSYNIALGGLADSGRFQDAQKVFDEMPERDTVTWNTIISMRVSNGCIDEAFRHLYRMRVLGIQEAGMKDQVYKCLQLMLDNGLRVDGFTISTVLSLCADTIDLTFEAGFQIHCFACKLGFESDPIVSTALVDIYSKMGLIDSAMEIFEKAYYRDLVSWNAIIIGLVRNGRGKDALRVFEKMLKRNTLPDRITFLGVLLACTSEDLISEGREIFSLMEDKYGVSCEFEHYMCMAELMGKTGRFCEAIGTINEKPYEAYDAILGTLLEECWVQGEIDLAETIAENMVKLETKAWLPYSILAQLHGVRGKWERVAGSIWRLVAERGVNKDQDLSWNLHQNRAYCFDLCEIFHYGGADTYWIDELLQWELELDC
ncbi:pentatricopeptide repeat-containing protein At1g33350-like [Carex rostrata]